MLDRLSPYLFILTLLAVPIGTSLAGSDGDGVPDALDCAPFDATAFGEPVEVSRLFLTEGGILAWDSQATTAGSGTVYDVIRGHLDELGLGDRPSEICLLSAGTATTTTDPEPAATKVFYYQARAVNACGLGPYGAFESSVCPAPERPLPTGVLVTGTAGRPISAEVLSHSDLGGFLVHQAWDDVETSKGVFDWTHLDGEFAAAVANGMKIRAAIHAGGDDAPKWLYDDDTIPFVLGKDGARFDHSGELTFSGNIVSISSPVWPGDLQPGKMIELRGTLGNDGRYRVMSDTTSSITVEEVFADGVNVDGTLSVDVVPCYWDPAVIQHKSDFYNALVGHLQTLGPAWINAMLSMSVSLVDPNTGDWSFVGSPDHLASYNAAGWLTGNDAEKQAGRDMFEAAMRSLYDRVLPNVPQSMVVGSAVGPVPGALLPRGTDGDSPARDILAYADEQYPDRVLIAKGALNARSYFARPCPATGTTWEDICAKPSQNFLQINWAASSPGSYKANGSQAWDQANFRATATVLKNAGLSAYSYRALWFEIWHADVDGRAVLDNPDLKVELDLAIAYIKDLFLNGVAAVVAPVAVQVPPATVTAPVGTEYVLQYVFDYNGDVPDLFEVRKDGVVVGTNLSYTIPNPVPADSGLYEISCRNSAGTTTVSTEITFE